MFFGFFCTFLAKEQRHVTARRNNFVPAGANVCEGIHE